MYKLHADDKTWVLFRETIEAFPNTLLANLIKYPTKKYPYAQIHGNDIYIDRDPASFKYVVDRMRNYEIYVDLISDDVFRKKVIDDLDHFDLYCMIDDSEINIKITDDIITKEEIPQQDIPQLESEPVKADTKITAELINKLSTQGKTIEQLKAQFTNSRPTISSSSSSLDLSEDGDYESV